jgi:large subunit ribosomal protein L21
LPSNFGLFDLEAGAQAGLQLQKAGHARLCGDSGTNTETKMFAVIKTGGKQFKVAAEDKIEVMTLVGEPGDTIALGEVMMIVDGDSTTVGAPFVSGASVTAQIVAHTRGPKVIAFKKRRRKNSKRKRGHRQDLTLVRITEISAGA